MIYLIRQDGQQEGPYPDEAVQGMYQRGQLPAGTLYWKQGMADWAPVHDLFDAPPPLPEDRPPPVPDLPEPEPNPIYERSPEPQWRARRSVGPRRWVRDVPDMAKATLITLSIMFGLGLVIAGFNFVAWLQLSAARDLELAQGLQSVGLFFDLFRTVCFLVSLTCFLFWFYRSQVNLRAWGADDLSGSPTSTVLWFFVPFANLFFIYKHVCELWRASGAPLDWRDQPLSRIVPYWWMLWVSAYFVGAMSAQFITKVDPSVDDHLMFYLLAALAELIRVGAAWFAIQLVKGITARQQALVEAE
ncbi:MAG: DUF4328 domain-containing protein [Verrucomicrobiota bacterium JB022]|nr:DUF4328 domain-containing protein [Verrucomicrobiota bacterium JB022]